MLKAYQQVWAIGIEGAFTVAELAVTMVGVDVAVAVEFESATQLV